MYESFYGFREKPFSLLPDAGFLYLGSKHRMALTLLEYGLMNQAGFSVVSGDIGTGKTTLIRHLLEQMDDSVRVGLIANTHSTFGDLLQWISLAFDLPYQGKTKVEMYQAFVDFVIDAYAAGQRTVLIVDEAQNMSAQTLEELRMLSNINADKHQVLQVILVGQRELRDTLRRPDLVQFAQRIAVDYHLEPLTREETADYIAHRCSVAGGRPELFDAEACDTVYDFTGGVPRLINLLCDTALVYGYAEQRETIGADLVREVGRDKQQGGLFRAQADVAPADAAPAGEAAAPTLRPVPAADRNLRVAIASQSELIRTYLARLLGRFQVDVVTTLPLRHEDLAALDPESIDVLLVELDDDLGNLDEKLCALLETWQRPVLFNDSLATEASLSRPNRLEYGRKLCSKLYSMVPASPQSVA
ncbi:MAG TPA: DUF2075 domain-containing protein [Gammaproteobacteria bacterium]|nr:DUF2075 domain-containing protein [Gammaproteobacteria bacterium]